MSLDRERNRVAMGVAGGERERDTADHGHDSRNAGRTDGTGASKPVFE